MSPSNLNRDRVLAGFLGPKGTELSCEQCFEEMDRFVELELAGAAADSEVPGMRAHLEGCPACEEDHASLLAFVAAQQDDTARLPSRRHSLTVAGVNEEHPRAALSAEEALDELLATIERGQVSVSELRVLLRLSARDETGEELADSLTQAPSQITRASNRLDKRGLIRRRFESEAPSGFVFSITEAGLATLEPLLTLSAEPHTRRAAP